MMKFVCLLTKKYEIPTDVSLNTIMVDGTGMCGACRITIGGKTKFVCVDGPEFDGHQVDFDEMLKRMGAFKSVEREEMHKLETHCEATKTVDENSRNAVWREELRKSIKAKERSNIERCKMNELDAEYRSHSRKEEVNQGLTKEQAVMKPNAVWIVLIQAAWVAVRLESIFPVSLKTLNVVNSWKQPKR